MELRAKTGQDCMLENSVTHGSFSLKHMHVNVPKTSERNLLILFDASYMKCRQRVL